MFFWNLANNPDRRFAPDGSQSVAWNRGAYLVQVLGHCGECHTPRNFMMAVNNGRQFAGAQEQGWLAYNITRDPTHGLGGWSDAALVQYLSTGHADGHGPASGPMAEVVEDSLRYLTPDDIHAVVTYLRTVPAQPDGPAAVVANGAPQIDPNGPGGRLFAQACEGCHLPNGTGRQSPWAALAGAQSVGDPDGANIVAILTQGSSISTSDGTMFMHSFTGGYTDPELAALGNYTIGQFGFRQGSVTPQQIKSAKQSPLAP
jgi:mono/diheme cytochrome c family protein